MACMIIENTRKKMRKSDKPVNILVTGKTGTGKSSLINAIIGKDIEQVAKEGKTLSPVTRDVTIYSIVVKGVQFNIWDTPGLRCLAQSDDEIIEQITTKLKQECTHIHLLVYCLRMDRNRIEYSEELVIKRVTDCFGPEIWETSVIVLTFANRVECPPDMDTDELEPIFFKQRLVEYKHEFSKILINYQMDKQKASEIAVIPTGYHSATRYHRYRPNPYMLPDRENWFNPFWDACINRMKETPYLYKTKKASCKEDLLTKQVEDNTKKIETLHKQAEQHQHIVKRMQQEHEAKMKEQETKMREEIKKLNLQVKDITKTIKTHQQEPLKIEQKNNKLKIGKIDPDSNTSLVTTIKDVFRMNIARLRSLLQDNIEVFAEEMLQEQLISDAVTRDPKNKTIVDNFLAKLAFMTEKEEIEQHCGKFLKVLQNVGEQGASKYMKKQLIDAVKTRLNIDLHLDNYT